MLCLVSLPLTIRGMTAIYNDMATTIGREKGMYLPQFAKEGFLLPTTLFFCIICGIVLVYIGQKRWRTPYAIGLGLYVLLPLLFGLTPSLFYTVSVVSFAVILLAMPRYWTIKSLISWGIALGCFALALSSARFVPNIESPVQAYVKEQWHTWQYGENTTDFLTDGDLTKLAEGKTKKQVVLSVMMEQPTALYLRGFVGARYENNRWQALSHEAIYDAQPLLTSLKNASLDSSLLLSQAYAQSAQSEKSAVHIYMKNGTTAHRFTPYELASSPSSPGFLDDGRNEQTLQSETDHYTYMIEPKAVVHYPITSLDEKDEPYLAAENHYNVFAYAHYTKLSKRDDMLLTTHMGAAPKTRTTYAQSIKKVQSFLSKELRYDTETKQLPAHTNFLQYTLEQTKRGYSPHYATIATLAFRHLGIPARYVEGYTVTNELVDAKQPLTEINVTGKEAHAWTEIYMDQLGWVPVEVTPGFAKKMPELETPSANTMPEASEAPSQEATKAQGEQAGTNQHVTEPKQTVDPAPKKENVRLAIGSGDFSRSSAFCSYVPATSCGIAEQFANFANKCVLKMNKSLRFRRCNLSNGNSNI
ncbi:transglutaminase-like domain-containing protein [Kurthia senegalensis]|uniref:transglutaminase-like domain-containing protein n=1 Tax=Kurthia senegalensis TaxID=1033740 RepID=UPI0002893BAA|nr:transglutaminase-like domain-containing protein [Kurthia senegalensis]